MQKFGRRAVLGGMGAGLAAPMVRAQSHAGDIANAFVTAEGLPGMTWAVRRLSGEVYTGAAGFADLGAGEWMAPDHRMRIASISKTLTAATILALEAEGKLWVGYKPFQPDGVFRDLVDESLPTLPMLERMTIDNLLTHTSGGWPNLDGDPMFLDAELGHLELIRKVLAERSPGTMPGSTYAYSNFGYCLLGRIIEMATLTDCTSAVHAVLAGPAGACSFALGGDMRADRLEGEVVYGFDDHAPYGMPLGRLDSAGGWVLTASDLLAIVSGFDGAGGEVIAPSVARRMAQPGTPGGSYGRGLLINSSHGNRWHNGSLPGTTSFVVMLENGDLVCALSNGRTETSGAAIETLVFDIYRAAAG